MMIFTCRRRMANIFVLMVVLMVSCQASGELSQTPSAQELNKALPPFLNFVAPAPQDVLLLNAYRRGEHYPQSAHPAPENGKNRICAEIIPESLLEPGDHFALRPNPSAEFLPDRVNAYVNSLHLQRVDEVATMLTSFYTRNDEGEVTAEAPGPQLICWLAELEPDGYIATIEVQKTSGELERYSWSFEIATR